MTVALVMGGATGIGAAVVEALSARGDSVVLADRDIDAADALINSLANPRALAVHADFADADAPARAVKTAVDLGDGVIDLVFYNAGVLRAAPLSQWTADAWDHSTAVNLRAPFLTAVAADAALRRSDAGRFIVTSSTGALRGHAGMPAYHATKSGLLGLVRALADEWGPAGVTANAVLPGWIDTPFNDDFWGHQEDPDAATRRLEESIPLRRQGEPGDVVGAVLFLASHDAAYITGQSFVVDGGYTAV
ncbi:3-oxoacyl-[acyl-carrier protein] reductase/2-deoxy-D-gluconate 3-dehydrogenase [Microbacterium sp. SLBN-154]|uniref:SDR family NAD(P)-dependent oxidoreductase n=1 Tax=Microbacterium sp. SLBN-154 TaxID=2768458 RepID=UPI0011505A87|nr:SDR family oxidoreductase [Microbacterium sp. SLBN-154]TQK17633.1 3-oxoacyl-[acyl-carrier protein] reductase/2-deoxy-D-gluconate 3-dehydrogenase [Microbacterium sp. SLBN-154]